MPTLRQLQYLVALHQTGHFRQAAERSGVSQPTLSAQILALEKRLGVQLVERNRTPAILTTAGERILELAKSAVSTVNEIHETARNLRKGPAGVIRLGVPPSIGPYLLPKVLPIIHSAFPDLRIYVREDFPLALPDALAAGTHNLLLAPLPIRGDDFVSRRLFREPLLLAVPADHRLAELEAIELSQLMGESILTLEKGHALREMVHDVCIECGAQVLTDYEGTSLETLHHMVIMGMGLAFLPVLYLGSAVNMLSGVKLLAIRGKPLTRSVGLVWRKTSADSATYERIAGHLRTAIREHFPRLTPLDG